MSKKRLKLVLLIFMTLVLIPLLVDDVSAITCGGYTCTGDCRSTGGADYYCKSTTECDYSDAHWWACCCADGSSCALYDGTFTDCGACGSCSYSDTCDESAPGTMRCYSTKCSGQYQDKSCTCTRDTDGTVCDSTDYCNGVCAWYTGKTCSGGGCSAGYGGGSCSAGTTCSGGSCSSGDCSGTDHCIGNTRYTGYQCDGSGNCNVDSGDIGCCQCSKCSSGNYCDETTYTCVDLPTCAECNTDFSYNTQEDDEDLWNDCSASWDSCDSGCVKRGGDGSCEGGVYACDTNDVTANITANKTCNGGDEVDANSTYSCRGDNAPQPYCSDSSCYDSEGWHYAECDGSGTCDDNADLYYATGAATASAGYSLNTTCSSEGTTPCNSAWECSSAENSDNAYNSGFGYYAQGYCDGAGTCDYSGPDITDDGDYSSSSCYCTIGGSGYWNIGGETNASVCCNNQTEEWVSTRIASSSMDNSYVSNSSDDACCNANTDCVNGSICYSNGTNYLDIDLDGDDDYCNATIWIDCIDDSGCAVGDYCWGGDCYTNETIIIYNLGQTGFEQTNQEYTSSRAVVLSLTYNIKTVTDCRYSNDMVMWSSWETCQPFKFWYLSDGDGLKTVYYQINRSGSDLAIRSDTITLESRGLYLDVTKPSYPTIIDEGDYTNSNSSLYAYWYGANDPELYFIGKSLEYAYRVYDNTTSSYLNSTWIPTGVNSFVNATNLNLIHNHTYSFEVRVNNSANLTNSSMSDGIIVDLVKPNVSLTCSQTQNNWSSNNTIYFNWSASETTIRGYSFVLDNINNTIPDMAIESNNSNVAYEANDGEWYFHIRARDVANNWGDSTNYGFIGIDTTPPNKPVVANPQQFTHTNNLSFTWTTYDDGSGVVNVSLNVTEVNGSMIFFRWLGNVTGYNITNATINKSYFATITAKDKVNLTTQSETIVDLNAPRILFSKPNGTIRNDPIIVIITNEKAICKFNGSNFEYTNSTYHETKIKNLADGVYQLNILCTDIVGYTTIHNINFNLNKAQQVSSLNLDMPSSNFVYNIINITIDTDLGEVRKGNFGIFIDNIKQEDYSIVDLGNGNYFLLLEINEPGTYTINVSVDSQMTSTSLTVSDLLLTMNYTASVTPVNKSRLTYHQANYYAIGLASDSKNVYVKSDTSELKLQNQLDGTSYLFVTKTGRYIGQKILHLERKTFEDYSQAFGYKEDDENEYKIMLDYNNIVVQNGPDISAGRNNLLVKNLGLNAKNQTEIDISLKK